MNYEDILKAAHAKMGFVIEVTFPLGSEINPQAKSYHFFFWQRHFRSNAQKWFEKLSSAKCCENFKIK